jgi:hypothetical protein
MKVNQLASAWVLPVALANLMPIAWGPNDTNAFTAPIKALLVAVGNDQDYKKVAPVLTNSFDQRLNVVVDVDFSLDRLTNKAFANNYDVVIYDACLTDAPPAQLQNALEAIHDGKPAVLIGCAVNAFHSIESVVHDLQEKMPSQMDVADPLQTVRLDTKSPILTGWPLGWKIGDDELIPTIDLLPDAHGLLMAKSPEDGRAHVVCWIQNYGKGRVFATTIGRDLTTDTDPAYQNLLTRGLLWSCDKLEPDGKPAEGYAR